MKSAAVPVPTGTFWVTRDRSPDGTLAPRVEVWTACPRLDREVGGLGAWWFSEGPDSSLEHRWCTWSLAEAASVIGNAIPDHERQCIVVVG